MGDSHQDDTGAELEADRYEQLVVIGDPTEATLLAARLRSEGIAVRTHGEAFGPYPVQVGGLAEVEIWVDVDRLEDARQIVATWSQ